MGSVVAKRSPPRVLFAWEHGRNLGHAARLSALSDEFGKVSAELVWAVPDGELNASWMRSVAGDRYAVPAVVRRTSSKPPPVRSFADMLALLGFTDEAWLQDAVTRWMDFFVQHTIDLVVLDYAPAAQLAAAIARLPAVQISNGFEAPPSDLPLFKIGVSGPMLERRNDHTKAHIDAAIRAVGRRAESAQSFGLTEFINYPIRWYDCIPETDPYGPRSDGVYLGPIGRLFGTVDAQWPVLDDSSARVLVYLRSATQVTAVLDALCRAGCSVVCAWPGATNAEVEGARRPGVAVFTTPLDLDSLIDECDAVISYGAVATTCKALLKGKRQLIWPLEVDKYLVARRIETLRAATVICGNGENRVLDEWIRSCITSSNKTMQHSFRFGIGDLEKYTTSMLFSNLFV